MSDLESILKKISYKDISIFDDKGNFTNEGYAAYQKLIGILYDLESITFDFEVSRIVDKLDEISS